MRSSRRGRSSDSSRRSGRRGGNSESSRRSSGGRRSRREQGDHEERGGRGRRGGAKSGNTSADKFLVYSGIGMGVAGIILLLVALSYYSEGKTKKRGSRAESASGPKSAPTAEPFRSEGEARAAFSRAKQLFAQGKSLTGERRNAAYREATQLCRRILASKVSNRLMQDAGRLRYDSMKHQTN